jgi:HEAT repeat protein
LSPAAALPPVEPPSAAFIVKLFLVPGLIVTLVLLIVLAFHWVAQQGSDPNKYIAALERNAANSWQVAHDIPFLLKRDPKLRQNRAIAQRLAALARQRAVAEPPALEARPDDAKNDVWLRVYLLKALGEFEVPDGLPVLVEVITRTERNGNEVDVRQSAIESLAVLVPNVRQHDPGFAPQDALEALLLASRESRRVKVRRELANNRFEELEDSGGSIRSRAAFALGVFGGPEAIRRLEQMAAGEAYVDARYNAAIGLARHGHPQCLPTLVEMLDPEETAGVNAEPEPGSREYKRALILVNALRASEQFVEQNPTADRLNLVAAIQRLADSSKQPAAARLEAKRVLNRIRELTENK